MSEVSCRACALILEGLRDREIPEETLVVDLPVSVAALRNPRNRISWDLFVRILERTEALCGGPEALERIGEAHIGSPTFDFLRKIGRLFFSPRDIYWMGAHWFGHAMFWTVVDHYEELPNGRIRETVELKPGYRDSPAFFRLLLGAIRTAPRHLKLPDAVVQMDLSPRRAVYEIEPPPPLTLWSRLSRRRWSLADSRTAIEEMRAEQEELKASYTRLEAANAELMRCDQELRAILASMDSTPVVLVDRNGKILSGFGTGGVGPRYGIQLGPFEGRMLARILPADTAELALRIIRDVFDRGCSRQVEHTLRAPTGEFRFDACLSPILGVSGEVRAVIIVSRDISERRRLREALEQSDRLATVGTLAAGIAHELRNPLGSILLRAERALALEEAPTSGAERRDCLDDIIADTERCSHIVKRVLRFARSESSEKVSCDLNAIVRTTWELISQYLEEKNSTAVLDLDKELPWVRADPIEIEQIIVNLVRNAVEAGGEKAHIMIRTEWVGTNARMVIRDSGPGLGDYEKQHIFDPFYTTRRDEGGMGLGLSVVHGIVTDHGGTVRAQRASGGGTEIVIELPTLDADAAPERG